MKNTKLFALAILLALVAAMVFGFWSSIMTVAVAAMLAYLLMPLVNFLCRKTRMRRGFAVVLVMLALFGLAVAGLTFTLPSLARQISSLITELTHLANNLDVILDDILDWLRSISVPEAIIDTFFQVMSQMDRYLTSFLRSLLSSVIALSTRIFDVIIIFILMVYFLLDWDKLVNSFIGIFPARMREDMNQMRQEAHTIIWKYVGSRCIVSGCMALATYLGLTIIGVPYSLLFAILSFILDFIPYFGSMAAGVIEAVVALFTGGVSMAVKTALFVLVVQQIEGNILAPKIQSDAVGLHPITVMFSLLACEQLWGAVGMLISTPVAALVKMVGTRLFRYAFYDDPEPAPPAPAAPDAPEAPASPDTPAEPVPARVSQ